jgi:hypothetical protein
MHLGTELRTAETISIKPETAGFIGGTTVMTLDGELPVEHLNVGDRVITRDTGMAVLRDIRVTEVALTPIRIKAGSLGHTRPDRDMMVAPGALIHIRDWRAEALFGKKAALVPARRLADGEFVAEQAKQTVTVYELVFDRQHILYVDGMEMASAAV